MKDLRRPAVLLALLSQAAGLTLIFVSAPLVVHVMGVSVFFLGLIQLVFSVREDAELQQQVAWLAIPESARAAYTVVAHHHAMIETDRRRHPHLYEP